MKDPSHPIYNSPIMGFAHHRIILDDAGKPADDEFLDVNTTFEKLTGLNANEIVGKTVTAAMPGIATGEFDCMGFFGEVAFQRET